MLRCPYCGSTRIVKDEKNGYLVCADCGSIIGEIYEVNRVGMITSRIHLRRINRINLRKEKLEIRQYEQRGDLSLVQKDKRARLRALNFLMALAPSRLFLDLNLRRALVSYIVARAQGYTHRAAIKKVSKEEKISVKALERIVKKYRPLLWYISLRVANGDREGEKNNMGSSLYSEENTCSNI